MIAVRAAEFTFHINALGCPSLEFQRIAIVDCTLNEFLIYSDAAATVSALTSALSPLDKEESSRSAVAAAEANNTNVLQRGFYFLNRVIPLPVPAMMFLVLGAASSLIPTSNDSGMDANTFAILLDFVRRYSVGAPTT